jgi:hypothetical protein
VSKALLFLIIGVALGGGAVWIETRSADTKPSDAKSADTKSAEEKPVGDEGEKPAVSRDENGNVVITISDETQGDMGILVTNPVAAQFAPELKGHGQILDPAPLAGMMNDLASTRAASTASSNELARLKTLSDQGNASPRALQTAEAAALRDQLAVQAARDRFILTYGKALAERDDLPALVQSLTSQAVLLARIDLPAGENLEAFPTGARLAALSGSSVEAEFLGAAAGVDPQLQGRGFFFLVRNNAAHLLPGEGVAGYLKLPGEPLAGVLIPREAVIRTEGKGWVYVLNKNGESFTRKEIFLDRPTENGWFNHGGVTAGDFVVVTGAQALLSVELSGAGFQGGGRD